VFIILTIDEIDWIDDFSDKNGNLFDNSLINRKDVFFIISDQRAQNHQN
jgi:hypothetical protein